MTNHVHMIIGSRNNPLENIMRDMKSHTSTALRKAITENAKESRKEWMLSMMQQAGTNNSNNIDFQFWQQSNHPLVLDTNYLLTQKLDYIHNNPVVAGFTVLPEEYLYSSARDYCGQKGLVDIILIE